MHIDQEQIETHLTPIYPYTHKHITRADNKGVLLFARRPCSYPCPVTCGCVSVSLWRCMSMWLCVYSLSLVWPVCWVCVCMFCAFFCHSLVGQAKKEKKRWEKVETKSTLKEQVISLFKCKNTYEYRYSLTANEWQTDRQLDRLTEWLADQFEACLLIIWLPLS